MAQDERTSENRDKLEDQDTLDLVKESEQPTEDLEPVAPVRKRFDSAQWITSW